MTNRTFMTVEEVAAELGVSKSYAYKIVKQLNDELQKLGYLTVAGRVSKHQLFPQKSMLQRSVRERRICMSIYKDNVTGKWRVVYRYTDWTGETKQTSKRGFPTKREAQMWEHEQMLKHDAKLDMTFASFYEIYVEDKKERIRDNTWGTKNNIARTKILPYFGERKIAEIEPKDVIAWQNHLLAFKRANGKGYSASYLRKIHSQLSAIFNHAVDFYHLPSNPAQKAGNIAIEEYKEMLF